MDRSLPPSDANLPVWERHARGASHPLTGAVECDVAVVGLGGSGLACVRALLADGARVVGLDAGIVAGGAAGRNGGFLLAGLAAFHHDAAATLGRERATRLYRLTLEEMDRMTAETPHAIRRVGSLRVAASPEEQDDCARQLEVMRADGLPVEPYEGPEGRGLLFPADGVFDPVARCLALAAAARAEGALLHEFSPVVDIRPRDADGCLTVVTEAGRVRCRAVVVAVDGRLGRILPELADPGLANQVRTVRLQMLATAPTTEVSIERAVYSRWGYDYWQQLPTGEVVLGGCRDLAMEEEWTEDATPSPVVQDALDRLLRERIGVGAPVVHRWAASVGYTTRGLPVAAEVRPGVWAIGGYSGTGNVVGALLGRAAAREARGERTEVFGLVRD
ncbi:MAG TPA: FAD-binding oxidoreductase [Gemmatimonadaceae bacterium]|nr:FAD-binding oxidoreductase [Gemmatimonadaceae bacterium]